MNYLKLLVLLIGLHASHATAALVHTFTANSVNFATLDITYVSDTEYAFTLSVLDPPNNQLNGAQFNFIDQLLFTSTPAAAPTAISLFSPGVGFQAQQPTIISVPGQALDAITLNTFDYDFGFLFAGPDAALALDRGETASWNATFSSGPVSFDQFGLVVLNNGGQQPKVLGNLSQSQPVPEPGSYAMLLAGLGLLGAVTKRKRS